MTQDETGLESRLRAHYRAIPLALPPFVQDEVVSSIRRSRQVPGRRAWTVGIAAVLAISAAAVSIALVGSTGPSPETPSSSPSATRPASASPGPSRAFVPGDVVRSVRALGAGEPPFPAGQLAFVVAGPVERDGRRWYRLQHWGDLVTGLKPDTTFLWIPAADAERSLVRYQPACPSGKDSLAGVAGLQPFERLVCFGDREITLGPVTIRDYQVGGVTGEPSWLASASDRWLSGDGTSDFFTALPFHLPPGLLEPADAAGWFTVTGHFDDKAAETCSGSGLAGPESERPAGEPLGWSAADTVLWCRERFVVARFEPTEPPAFELRGTWRPTALPPIDGRAEHAMVWTGKEAMIWGGFASSPDRSVFEVTTPRGGAAYDPATDRWRTIPDAPIPGRGSPVMAWTGREVVVFGGWVGDLSRLDGAAWNPETNRWRTIAASPLTGKEAIGAWLADRLIVVTSTSAAAYDPVADRWTELPPASVRVGWRTAAVAAGRLFVVAFGDGATPPVDWAVLDLVTETWTNGKAPIDPLEAGVVFKGAGDRIVVTDTGDTFDPLTATWRTGPRCEGVSAGTVWTGRYLLGVTAAWDALTGDCLQLPPAPPREPPFDDSNGREFPVAVWTGREYITWSGGNGGDIVWVPKDGAIFRPDKDLEP